MIWLSFALVFWLAAWRLNVWLSHSGLAKHQSGRLLVPAVFGITVLVVGTIISLRKENTWITTAERMEADRLGLKFLHFPFYGIFGASRSFIERILAEMRDPGNGMVYVHCQRGRDRSSLLVALHLVPDPLDPGMIGLIQQKDNPGHAP